MQLFVPQWQSRTALSPAAEVRMLKTDVKEADTATNLETLPLNASI
jgi:hypothetical protein